MKYVLLLCCLLVACIDDKPYKIYQLQRSNGQEYYIRIDTISKDTIWIKKDTSHKG